MHQDVDRTPELDQIEQQRRARLDDFSLNLDLDEEFGEYSPAENTVVIDTPAEALADTVLLPSAPMRLTDEAEAPVSVPAEKPAPKKQSSNRKLTLHQANLLLSIVYIFGVLIVSVILSYAIVIAGIDVTGINKSSLTVKVVIPSGMTSEQIADILSENDIIDHPTIFHWYTKLVGIGGTLRPGTYDLAPNMGYQEVINILQAGQKRESVRVTIPEGFTVEKIAALLEEKNICTAEEFCRAVNEGEYDYDFIRELPTVEDNPAIANRVYRLEGYLFPDTYDMFTNSTGEEAVTKMLDNFNVRVNASVKAAIKAKGLTVHEVIVLASIVQGEVADSQDMLKVARVLINRLNNPSTYPRLECDSTRTYAKNLQSNVNGIPVVLDAYDTYVCEGLPVSAIGNPGLETIRAVISPSTDATVKKCYFFATDTSTGITYYSQTYAQHVNICKKYHIGAYA